MTKKREAGKGGKRGSDLIVAVAMSGGVDSSAAAALLTEQGNDVIGITMKLFGRPMSGRDAGAVAEALGIPFYVADFRRTFERDVVADFVKEYGRGRTPSPCLRCNRLMKFGALLRRARRLGAARIATGHYARVDFDEERGRWRLRKGKDPEKDQSYFLYGLGQEELARAVFPLGDLTKGEVRTMAERFGLPIADKAESQEICFIPDNDYAAFLRTRIPRAFQSGSIIDTAGKVVGRHDGLANYTIGQRKGMGIAAARPLYVVALDPKTNTVIAGEEEELYRLRLVAADVRWGAIEGFEGSGRPIEATVKIRSRHEGAPAVLTPGEEEGTVVAEFAEAQRAITPGQAAVFYSGDVVLGGGTINR